MARKESNSIGSMNVVGPLIKMLADYGKTFKLRGPLKELVGVLIICAEFTQ